MSQDLELTELRRRFDQDPENEPLRQTLILKYMRAGQREQAEALIHQSFRCPLKWTELSSTEQAGELYCGQCQETVHVVDEPSDIEQLVNEEKCIAAPSSWVSAYLNGRIVDDDPQQPPPYPKCSVENNLSHGSFDPKSVPDSLLEDFNKRFPRPIHAMPISDQDGQLVVSKSIGAIASRYFDMDALKAAYPGHDIILLYTDAKSRSELWLRNQQVRDKLYPRRKFRGIIARPKI